MYAYLEAKDEPNYLKFQSGFSCALMKKKQKPKNLENRIFKTF